MTETQISTRRRTCDLCFKPIEKGEEFIYAPFGRSQLAVVSVHLGCAKEKEESRLPFYPISRDTPVLMERGKEKKE